MKFQCYTLGCKVNQYETQAMEQQLLALGHVSGTDADDCDAYLINTCTVTAVADRKNCTLIRRLRREHPQAVIGVCGCYAQVSAGEVEGSRRGRRVRQRRTRGLCPARAGRRGRKRPGKTPGSRSCWTTPCAAVPLSRSRPGASARAPAPCSRCRTAAATSAPTASSPTPAGRCARCRWRRPWSRRARWRATARSCSRASRSHRGAAISRRQHVCRSGRIRLPGRTAAPRAPWLARAARGGRGLLSPPCRVPEFLPAVPPEPAERQRRRTAPHAPPL